MNNSRIIHSPIRITKSMLGGSLCEVVDNGPLIHKYYKGNIQRGHEKLLKEFLWYDLIPTNVRNHYPYILPGSYLGTSEKNSAITQSSQTSLYVQKVDRRSLSKLIIGGVISNSEAISWFTLALDILMEVLYPLRTRMGQSNIFKRYHEPRLNLALNYLKSEPRFRHLFEGDTVIVNDNELLGLNTYVNWIDRDDIKDILNINQLVSIHGNLHPDNILISDGEFPNRSGITFIDPRGDLLGPLYYDAAKIMTSLHSRYDEVHYDTYKKSRIDTNKYKIQFLSTSNSIFHSLMETMLKNLSDWAIFSRQKYENFLMATLLCEAIHTFSFSFYHYKRRNPDLDRVETYLLIACYLATQVEKAIKNGISNSVYENRLNFDLK